jgi:hypothetical protein
MEHKPIEFHEKNAFDFANISSQSERLNAIITANAEVANGKSLYRNDLEMLERELMKKPLTNEKAFANFGLLLGTFPPMTIFGSFLSAISKSPQHDNLGVIAVFLVFINTICAVVGYYSGKRIISRLVAETEKLSWSAMLLLMPLIGVLWGTITGGVGAFPIFVIGAFFGAIIASTVGSLALTTFTVFHRLLKRGDSIEQKHFMPLAFGITATICAFILGLTKF